MNMAEFLEHEAKRFGFDCTKTVHGDYDLRVAPIQYPGSALVYSEATASDLIQLLANLQESGYVLTFVKVGNNIRVQAPHRKDHGGATGVGTARGA